MPKSWDQNENGRFWYDGAWRSKESIEKRLEKHRAKHKTDKYRSEKSIRNKERRKNDPEFRERERASAKRYYEANKSKESARKKEYIARNREKVRAYSRELYDRDREQNASKAKERKHRNNPTIGLFTAINDVKTGKRELDSVIRQFRKAFGDDSGNPSESKES